MLACLTVCSPTDFLLLLLGRCSFNTGNGGHYIVRPASLDTFQAYGQVALGSRGLMYYTWGSIYNGGGSNGTGAGP